MYEYRQYSQNVSPQRGGAAGQTGMSRQERVLAAKAAFGNTAGGGQTVSWREGREREGSGAEEAALGEGAVQIRFGLMRFMASGMLLLVLLAAFATGFSYHGFDQSYVEERMNDETTWTHLEEKVQKLYVEAMKQYQAAMKK